VRRRRFFHIFIFSTLLVSWGPQAWSEEAPVEPYQTLVATLHVHSTISTGTLSLSQVVEQAERLGLDAVLLSENFVLRYDYGLFPFRDNVRVTKGFPSVLEYGLLRFFREVAENQAQHPTMVLVPGVEVAPYFYWSGSLLNGNLTIYDAQKNFLVFGLPHPEDFARLPVLGSRESYSYGWGTILSLLPSVFFLGAIWLWKWKRPIEDQMGKPEPSKGKRVLAVILAVGVSFSLVNAWPYNQPRFDPYDTNLGYEPYQHFIDAVKKQGGLVYWSMPEIKDFHIKSMGPLGKMTIKTDPQPQALIQTTGYDGFGGIYQDTRTATQPGGIWDQTLGLYLRGERKNPPFVIGEIAYHGPYQIGKKLDHVLTVLWVKERTPSGVIEALKGGRYYAVDQTGKDYGLRLNTFRIDCEHHRQGVISGEAMLLPSDCHPTLSLLVTATDKGHHPVSVRIIRSGKVVSSLEGVTPFSYEFVDGNIPRNRSHYYRLEVRGGGEIVSNPIFVKS